MMTGKLELWLFMPLKDSNEPLSVYSFIVKDSSKWTKSLSQQQLAVLIAEGKGHSFGKLFNITIFI